MTAPRYRSAWDDAEQPDVERVSENVARGAEPIREVALGARETHTVAASPVQTLAPAGPGVTSFSAALAQALAAAGPPRTKWGTLAQRVGVPPSLLRRMRLGLGVSGQSMDKVAKALHLQITITQGD